MTVVRDRLWTLHKSVRRYASDTIGGRSSSSCITSVECFERGNGFAIVGLNPAGDKTDADDDDPQRPFKEEGYSAYLDDRWRDRIAGQGKLQLAVQGIAMIIAGATPTVAMRAIRGNKLTTVQDHYRESAEEFLRQTPSCNINPFRSGSPNELGSELWSRGADIGWELLRMANPRIILTLANGPKDTPWSVILERSGLPPRSHDYEEPMPRNFRYRDVRLGQGDLKDAIVIGLPAIVRFGVTSDITPPLFKVLRKRLRYYGVI